MGFHTAPPRESILIIIRFYDSRKNFTSPAFGFLFTTIDVLPFDEGSVPRQVQVVGKHAAAQAIMEVAASDLSAAVADVVGEIGDHLTQRLTSCNIS
jgi:hypothetical protein